MRLPVRALGRILAVSGLLLVLSSLLVPLAGCNLLYVVSGSMEPYVPIGSLVLLCRAQPSVGDVAAYSLYGKTVIHRVSSIDLKGGTMLFVADANPVYPSVVEIEKVRGVALLAVPLLGYLAMNRLYIIFFLAAVLAIVLSSSLYKISEKDRR
jgi:signal peptidase